jgi:hypothetical protein
MNDDLIIEDEEEAPKQGLKWLALVNIHTTNSFSPITFEQHMRNAWSPVQRVKFNHLEGNSVFLFGRLVKSKRKGFVVIQTERSMY